MGKNGGNTLYFGECLKHKKLPKLQYYCSLFFFMVNKAKLINKMIKVINI